MAISTVYTGTWEEVKSHEEELRGRQVEVRVITAFSQEKTREQRVAEMEETIQKLKELGKRLPKFPERALTTDVYYPDDPI